MAKVVPIKSAPERTNLAVEVEVKLDAARGRVVELEAQVGDVALADALGQSGGSARLAQVNSQLDLARRDVRQLEQAHRVALMPPLR